MTKIGILGYGEIGKAVEKLYTFNNIISKIKDVDRDDGLEDVDILNVCIPYSEQFNDILCEQPETIKCFIIHSTIGLYAIKQLKIIFPDKIIVHSPVRGIHPNLFEGLLTFEKLVGAETEEDAMFVSNHLNSLGIKTQTCDSNTSILAKLLDTTYYGLCIAFHGEAAKMCNDCEADFETAMTFYNTTYNKGYKKLGKSNVVRPVLFPPGDSIGGHCVVPNAKILDFYFDSKMLDLILEYG